MEKVGEAFVEIGAKQSAGFNSAFKQAEKSAGMLSGAFGLLKTAAKVAAMALAGGLALAAAGVAAVFGPLKEKDQEFSDQVEETSGAVKGLFSTLADVLGPALKDMMLVFEGVIIKLGEWIKETFDAENVAKFFADALTFTVAVGIKVYDTIKVLIDVFGILKTAVTSAGDILLGVFKAIATWSFEPIEEALGKAAEDTSKAFHRLAEDTAILFGDNGWDRAQTFLGGARDVARDTHSAVKATTKEMEKQRALSFMGLEDRWKDAALATMTTSAGNTKVGGDVFGAAIERHNKRQVDLLQQIVQKMDQGAAFPAV